ncbi:hypothetical protein DM860_013149 [Cuscuta australis]|uniref:Uncharacterized protein n=1 Tax=Cuscuta australis TaxID=267555 RepID=A0A328D7C3_9ASTE|nr:hypothetical protein DM860_013149 [Cuscuta australis]
MSNTPSDLLSLFVGGYSHIPQDCDVIYSRDTHDMIMPNLQVAVTPDICESPQCAFSGDNVVSSVFKCENIEHNILFEYSVNNLNRSIEDYPLDALRTIQIDVGTLQSDGVLYSILIKGLA